PTRHEGDRVTDSYRLTGWELDHLRASAEQREISTQREQRSNCTPMNKPLKLALAAALALGGLGACSLDELEDATSTTRPGAESTEATTGNPELDNAIRSAQSYLDTMAFSRQGLIRQLTSEYGEQYPPELAEQAVAHLEAQGAVDWNAEAVESAESYLEHQAFSRQGLIDQLTSEYGEQFTPEQAQHAVSQVMG